MRKKRKIWIVWIVGIVAALFSDGGSPATASRKQALHWIDVGQGACLVAVGSDAALVIDSGPAGASEAILRALGEHGITRVDLWIHTHFDADHLGGIIRAAAGLD
ncbi:MAG TPA: MBL fold metallo-hydrolase, partial [Nannocystis exedens]|nr:MBL fold metallo-hydrolase [Nannocystis exedens]